MFELRPPAGQVGRLIELRGGVGSAWPPHGSDEDSPTCRCVLSRALPPVGYGTGDRRVSPCCGRVVTSRGGAGPAGDSLRCSAVQGSLAPLRRVYTYRTYC